MNCSTTNGQVRSSAIHRTFQYYQIKKLIFIWREEVFIYKNASLLQRSNISIEETGNLLTLQWSAMQEALENDATNLVSKTLHTL